RRRRTLGAPACRAGTPGASPAPTSRTSRASLGSSPPPLEDEQHTARLVVHDRKPALLEHAQRRDVPLRDAGIQRPLVPLGQEERHRPGRDAAAPVLAPDPVPDLALAVAVEASDVTDDVT